MSEALPYDLDKVMAALLRVGWRVKEQSRYVVFERKGHSDHVMHIARTVFSIHSHNGIPIRFTNERWAHIIEGHPEVIPYRIRVAQAVSQPERLYLGNNGEYLALLEIEPEKWLVVVYRETTLDMEKTAIAEIEEESFIITAYVTRRIRSLEKRQRIL